MSDDTRQPEDALVGPPPGIYRRVTLDRWVEWAADKTCDRCGRKAGRPLAAEHLCWTCSEETLGPIRDRVMERKTLSGIGLIDYPASADHPLGMWTLRCNQCNATWVGYPDEDCPWCQDKLTAILLEQDAIDSRKARQ